MTVARWFVFALIICQLQSYSYAQEKSKTVFGKVSPQDFTLPSNPIIDSNSNAVILSDIGDVHFTGNKSGWFSYVYQRRTRIKILNKKAFELATVRIRLYSKNEDVEKADKLEASTYNLEDGKVVEAKLNKNEIYDERVDKNHLIRKFTMPAVKEGSIIEYTYTIISDFDFNLPPWQFQSVDYPCLWSEYKVNIPQTLSYAFIRHGVHKFAVDKGGEGHEAYMITQKHDVGSLAPLEQNLTVTANTILHTWVMKDIPAFHVENYLSAPDNYTDRIEFQLSGTYNGEDKHDVMNSWKKANEDLLNKENFGRPLREPEDWVQELSNKAADGHTDPLDAARSIYYYVSDHFTCTNRYDPFIKTSLRDVAKKNSGTVGDINLLLTALLRSRNIQADPVLLSTREYGFNSSTYPMMDKLNYVVVRAKIGEKAHYLDATHPLLGFGSLAGNCYNGHARIISEKDSGSVYFWADSLKEQHTTMVFIQPGTKENALEGSYQSVLGKQESYDTRLKVRKTGVEEYFKKIQTGYGQDIDISNTGIDSLDKREEPVKVYYDFSLKPGAGASLIYFNPMFEDALRENPFKAAERQYPVEMGYATDHLYILNMEIPDGYEVDEIPKSAKVAFNGDQGIFEYLVAKDGRTIQLRCHLKMNKAWFAAEDYASLRDFFGFVVKKESETIVLKKKP